jgi:hypothetical protein
MCADGLFSALRRVATRRPALTNWPFALRFAPVVRRRVVGLRFATVVRGSEAPPDWLLEVDLESLYLLGETLALLLQLTD